MKKLLALVALICALGGIGEGATVTDQSSSKNELLVKGATPHVRFMDDDATGNYQITVNGGVMKFSGLNTPQLFNFPWNASAGLELREPQGVGVITIAGGTLPVGTYFIVVTALDGVGETIKSSQVTCATIIGNQTCRVSWTATPPPAVSYNVYYGTTTGVYTKFFNTVGTTFDITADTGTLGSPPAITTAYQIKLEDDGIHFPDGSVQNTAGASGTWMFNVSHILNSNSGNVGIKNGTVFTPDAKLTVIGNGIDVNDQHAIVPGASNRFELRSNYKISTDRLWNTGLTSWMAFLDSGFDSFSIFRAPATAGAPSYSPLFVLDNTGGLFIEGNLIGLKARGQTTSITYTPGNTMFIWCTGGGITINLPTATVDLNRVYVIKNIGLVGNCTIDPAGIETIDLSLTTLTLTPGSIARLASLDSGGDWERW